MGALLSSSLLLLPFLPSFLSSFFPLSQTCFILSSPASSFPFLFLPCSLLPFPFLNHLFMPVFFSCIFSFPLLFPCPFLPFPILFFSFPLQLLPFIFLSCPPFPLFQSSVPFFSFLFLSFPFLVPSSLFQTCFSSFLSSCFLSSPLVIPSPPPPPPPSLIHSSVLLPIPSSHVSLPPSPLSPLLRCHLRVRLGNASLPSEDAGRCRHAQRHRSHL